MKIREAINKLILEERFIAEANNVTFDAFSPQINESEYLIDKVVNLTINVGNENNLVNKVENLTINVVN